MAAAGLTVVAFPQPPMRKTDESLFLPIEGDRTLSLILGKAFLLTDDTNLADRTILWQIGG